MVLSSTSVNRKLPSTKSISSRTAVHGFSFNSGCLETEARSHFPASKGGPGRTSLVAAAASAGKAACGSGFGAAGSWNRGDIGFGPPRFRTFGLGGGVKRGQGRRQSSPPAAAGEALRLSPGSDETATTCGLGPGTVSRLQADCIRAVQTWCKLGPGDHLAVQVTHQQAATPAATPALLISAATCFAGPDGRRHALIALSLAAAVSPSAFSPPTHHSATSGFGREDKTGTASNSNDTSNGALADILTADVTAPSTAASAPAATTASPALSSSPMLEPYEGLEAHWGCCQGPGQRWYGGPPGWHTLPAVSHDAGHGAWQTPFVVRQAVPLATEEAVQQGDGQDRPEASSSRAGGGPWVAVYSLMLQLPWEGPIRQGGVSFVLKAAGNVWIKARPSAADGGSSNILHSGGSETDFWVGTSDLPLAASGRPLLSDAFRTGNPDENLPLVFPSQPAGCPSGGSAAAAMAAAASEATSSSATSNTAGLTDTAATARPTISYSNAGIQPAAIAGKLQEPQHQPHIRRHKQSDQQPAGRQAEAGTPGGREKGGGGTENQDLLGVAAAFVPPPRRSDELLRPAQRWPLPSNRPMGQAGEADMSAAAAAEARQWLVDLVAQREPGAERSLMHRYNSGAELVEMLLLPAGDGQGAGGGGDGGSGGGDGGHGGGGRGGRGGRGGPAVMRSDAEVEAALAVVTAWLRFSSARLLVWNRNYNVKPREVATAQARLAAALAALGASRGPQVCSLSSLSHSSPSNGSHSSSSSPTSHSTSSSPQDPASSGGGGGGGGSSGVGALVRVALAAVGRGGCGEVGQRIRDEILAVQHRNGCKGGMMEEWHQKLHNNTSPDDVVICQALLDYIAAGLDLRAYWSTLHAAGITAQRLASFDRPIRSEPRFSGQQAAGLQRDLRAYLQTLRAVHGGDDLRSAADNVLGFEQRDMKGHHISVPPVPHVTSPQLATHLRALLALHDHLATANTNNSVSTAAAATSATSSSADAASATSAAAAGPVVRHRSRHRPADVASLCGLPGALRFMEMAVEARHLIRPFLDGGEAACGGRLVDVVFLDLALESALRTTLEGQMTAIRQLVAEATQPYIASSTAAAASHAAHVSSNGSISGLGQQRRPQPAAPVAEAQAAADALSQVLEVLRAAVEAVALSSCPNDDLVAANKWLRLLATQADPRDARDRMLQTLALLERLQRAVAAQAVALLGLLQPAAEQLGGRLGVRQESLPHAGEEAVRGGPAAPLAQLLALLEPPLRRATGGSVWQERTTRHDTRPFA